VKFTPTDSPFMIVAAMNNDVPPDISIESLKNDFEKQFNYKLNLTMQL